MTSLVSDFLINPVLRQARRFSRPSEPTPAHPHGQPMDGELSSPLRARHGGPSHSDPGPREAIPLRRPSRSLPSSALDGDVSENPSLPFSNGLRRSTLEQGGAPEPSTTGGQFTSSLPEDDGMRPLRQKIASIQASDISAPEKARLMHELLTEGYYNSHSNSSVRLPVLPRAPSPASMVSIERPTSPGSLSSFMFWQQRDTPDTPGTSPPNSTTTFLLSAVDLKPTFAPPDPREPGDDDDPMDEDEHVPVMGCAHYKRNVKLQCSACNRWYTCRFCHDEVEDHALNRKETRHMLCMFCGAAQRASDSCVNCGESAAYYYCGICKLWDNDPSKSIYHCNDCGICRKGRGLGKDFIHCKTCGVCMSISIEKSHKCIERSTDCDCPICGEYMFASPKTVVFMNCGHSIHHKCYYAHMQTSYKCPICNKSTINMETQFRNLDRAIESQPMPPQFQDTLAMISCNDCYAKSAVKYHWLGLKCAICDSYNTRELQILSDPAPQNPTQPQNSAVLESTEHANVEIAANPRNHLSTAVPHRTRRHSSVSAMPSMSLHPEDQRFSPYPPPQRIGRSVSPPRVSDFFAPDEPEDPTLRALAAADLGDGLTFWGGDGGEDDNEDEESEESEASEMDEDDEDEEEDEGEDEDDHMELFGHR